MSAAELAKIASHTLAEAIDAAFDRRDEIGPATKGAAREAVEDALDPVSYTHLDVYKRQSPF